MSKKKNFFIGFGVLAVLVVLILLFQSGAIRRAREKMIVGQILREDQALENAYRKNTYGGATPEETLQLFITALKAGDADLAAKYFVPEKEKEMREVIKIGMKNNNIDKLISILNKEKKGNEVSENIFVLDTFDDNNNAEFSFRFLKNKFTQKWLIESL